jgi:hypothetical protein
LIDRAEQKAVRVSQRAQALRERTILRRGDHEERIRDVGIAYGRGIANPHDVRAGFA